MEFIKKKNWKKNSLFYNEMWVFGFSVGQIGFGLELVK